MAEAEEGSKKQEETSPSSILSAEEIQCWSSVKEDPSDFQSWIKLLQIAEQKAQVDSARDAYEQFLQHYPFCYGYWKKYAEYEKRQTGIEKAKAILERGLAAVPLSVDLWIHYIRFDSSSSDQSIRSAYEDALSKCGMDTRSGRLWESFIEWEKSRGNLEYVLGIYDRLLVNPVMQCEIHFERFKQFVTSNDPQNILKPSELLELKGNIEGAEDETKPPETTMEEDVDGGPPGMETSSVWDEEADVAPPGTGEEDSSFTAIPASTHATPLANKLREQIIESRRNVFNITLLEMEKRKPFESAIKRPYFHAKPLDKVQLQNWREYLDFEIAQGDKRRILLLFERCVIACALYEEFWLKFIDYIEPLDSKYAGRVYDHACTAHCPRSVALASRYALFAARTDDVALARSILEKMESKKSGTILARIHRIVLERQHSCFDKVEELYRDAIDNVEDLETRIFYLKRYSTFALKYLKDTSKARDLMKEAIDQDTNNESLYLQWLDLEISECMDNQEGVMACFDFIQSSSLNCQVKASFAHKKLQYLQEFGGSLVSVLEAYEGYAKDFGGGNMGAPSQKRMPGGETPNAKRMKSDLDNHSTTNGSETDSVKPEPMEGNQAESTTILPAASPSTTVTTTAGAQQQADPAAWAAAYGQQYQEQYQQYQQQQWAAYYNQQQQQQQAGANYGQYPATAYSQQQYYSS